VILRDISERTRAETELQTERDRLSLALTTGKMGVYEVDLAQNALWLSPESYSLLGTTPHDFSASPDAFVELVHPQGRELLLQHIKGSIQTHELINHEFRIVRPDGRECWVSCQGQADYNEAGERYGTRACWSISHHASRLSRWSADSSDYQQRLDSPPQWRTRSIIP
jgi:PAS domain-containing protein